MMDDGFRRLWDARDVAQYLNVSRSWVYHRAEAGLLPCRRIGGCLRFVPSEIRSLVEGDPTAAVELATQA
jgi:predicted DNA-binding transcriptional regulator AlpA